MFQLHPVVAPKPHSHKEALGMLMCSGLRDGKETVVMELKVSSGAQRRRG